MHYVCIKQILIKVCVTQVLTCQFGINLEPFFAALKTLGKLQYLNECSRRCFSRYFSCI